MGCASLISQHASESACVTQSHFEINIKMSTAFFPLPTELVLEIAALCSGYTPLRSLMNSTIHHTKQRRINRSILFRAAHRHHHSSSIGLLLETGAEMVESGALHCAALLGKYEALEVMVKAGADVSMAYVP